jgi:hypothetical protein
MTTNFIGFGTASSQMMPSQQPNAFQRVMQSLNLAPSRPPTATELVDPSPPADRPPFIPRASDEDRLRAIVEAFPGRVSQAEWGLIADLFGPNVSVRQVQDLWYNLVMPGLDRGPFTMTERRLVARLAIDHPLDWGWIAAQLGNGRRRSAAMAKHCAHKILGKLSRLGFEIESSSDLDFVPDSVFEHGTPNGAAVDELLAEFRKNKARRAAEVAVRRPRYAPTLGLTVQDLIANQPKN